MTIHSLFYPCFLIVIAFYNVLSDMAYYAQHCNTEIKNNSYCCLWFMYLDLFIYQCDNFQRENIETRLYNGNTHIICDVVIKIPIVKLFYETVTYIFSVVKILKTL